MCKHERLAAFLVRQSSKPGCQTGLPEMLPILHFLREFVDLANPSSARDSEGSYKSRTAFCVSLIG